MAVVQSAGISPSSSYRGRLAPTPSGYLHAGHAATFGIARDRARQAGGVLLLRNDNLDRSRCRVAYEEAMFEDLQGLGLDWEEGWRKGGPYAPYDQASRLDLYREVWWTMVERRLIYPSPHSRKDVREALSAPQEGRGGAEVIFPATLRPASDWMIPTSPEAVNWRFAVPLGEDISFVDGRVCSCSFLAGKDFGDFLVWRKDGYPSYELATVVDDHLMRITEVVRGEDLLLSTARQLLLYRALQWESPAFFHCPLLRDEKGRRLAKRDQAARVRY